MFEKSKFPGLATMLIVSLTLGGLLAMSPPSHAATGGNGSCEYGGFAGGDGSTGAPWQVGNAQQLKELGDCSGVAASSTSGNYTLISNIDLGGSASPWQPIGGNGFKGNLDGAGYTITGLFTRGVFSNQSSDVESGLFNQLLPGSSVENLAITGAMVYGETAGILAARSEDRVSLHNLTISGQVFAEGTRRAQSFRIGGVAGHYAWKADVVTSSSTVSGLVFEGSLINNAGVGGDIGGLFGSVGNSSSFGSPSRKLVTVQSSSATVKIVSLGVSGDGEKVGGLAAFSHNTIWLDNAVKIEAEIYSSAEVGGALAFAESVQIDGLYVEGLIYAASGSPDIGGVAENLREDTRAGITASIRNSLVNLSVHLETPSADFGGVVQYLNNGVVEDNIVISSIDFPRGNRSAIVNSTFQVVAGTTISIADNLFDTTQTHLTSSLTSAQALGVSSSSLSEVATLNGRGFDTSGTWQVVGMPQLRKVPASQRPPSPVATVARTGDSVNVYFGSAVASGANFDLGDFEVNADGASVGISSITGSVTDSRSVQMALLSSIDQYADVVVSYQRNSSPPVDYPFEFLAGTNISEFSTTATNKVAYMAPSPTPSSLSVLEVQSFERTLIQFEGSNLLESTIQMKLSTSGGFGYVEVVSASATQVQFMTPTLTPSSAARDFLVRVTTKGGSVQLDQTIRYLGAPSISSVTPAIGGPGTIVEVGGSNLSTATTVSFGSTQVAVSSATATTISVVAPSGTVGQTVNITAAGPGWTSTLNSRFEFTQSPSLSGISLASGSTAGGETVTLTGVTLSDLISVTFGGVQATVQSSSSSEIQVTTPAAFAGVVDVVVRTGGGTSTLASAYTYVTPAPPQQQTGGSQVGNESTPPVVINTPTITEFSTREIPASGAEVTATGLRLENLSSLTLGGITVTIVANTATSITFTTGEMPVGVWDLRLVGSNGTLVFQQAIEVVAATAIVGESTGELLGWTWTLKFLGNSRSLHLAQSEHLASKLDEYSTAETIICWGYTTAENPNAWAIAHATQRAQAACDLASANNSEVKTVVRLRYGVSKNWAMRSALQFWR